jgi:metal-sulfur cluster biosynthetic enzyme
MAPADQALGERQMVKRSELVRRIWQTLGEIEDPEIPVSLVGMGLIVSVDYEPASQTAQLQITYTAMGCPAMEMIQEDIRDRLLREPEIVAVEIEVVWDPVWTRKRLSDSAKETMRELGIAV